MSEDARGVRAAIDHVEQELARASLDAETRARLKRALEELHAALDDERAPDAGHRDDLFEAVEHFAEQHPGLSTSLGRLVDILAKMGI